jgi:hypothetical protein
MPTPQLSDSQRTQVQRLLKASIEHAAKVDHDCDDALASLLDKMGAVVAQGGNPYNELISELKKWRLLFAAAVRAVENTASMVNPEAAGPWKQKLLMRDAFIEEMAKSGRGHIIETNLEDYNDRMKVLEMQKESSATLKRLRERYSPY